MRSTHLRTLVALVALTLSAGVARADIIDCTVRDYQDTTSVMWDTLSATDTLRMVGIVSGADTRAAGFGFYIEDFTLSAQYRGILVFGGVDIYNLNRLQRGYWVRVTGRFTEYLGGSEIISPTGSSFGDPPPQVDSLGVPGLPGPTIVTTGDIAERSVTGEIYEGMFVKLDKSVRITNTNYLPFNTAQAVNADGTAPFDTILIDCQTLANPAPTRPDVGLVITFLQGIVDQRGVPSGVQLRGYRIQIRDGADIEYPAPPSLIDIYAVSNDSIRVVFDRALDPITAQNPLNYSRMTGKDVDAAYLQPEPSNGIQQIVVLETSSEPQVPAEPESVVVSGVKSALGMVMPAADGEGFLAGVIPIAQVQTAPVGRQYNGPGGTDTTQYLYKTLTVRGIVTGVFPTLTWVADAAGGLRSGIKLYAGTKPYQLGHDVTVVGIPIEYYDETEFSGAIFERIHGAGTMPPPVVLASTGLEALNDTVAAGGTREDYEHVLVRILNIGIEDDNVGFGEWLVKGGDACFVNPACDDTVHIDDRGVSNYAYRPTRGDQFTSITAPIEISFNVTKLEPRLDSDFVRGPVLSAGGTGHRLALRCAGANPVSFARGGAEFAVTLPGKGKPVLALYDLRGRLVKTLTNGRELEPGLHQVGWDGADAAGRRVGSGIYFVQLRLGDEVATAKLVVAN